MVKIIKLMLDNTSILVESSENIFNGGIVQAGAPPIEKNFDKILKRLKPFSESIINHFEDLSNKPNSASAEFGLKFTGEGNIFIAKASGEATLKITLNWDIKNGSNT